MEHHKQHYPVNNLLRPGPYIGGGGEYAFGPVVLVILGVAYFLIGDLCYFVIFVVQSMGMLLASDYLHTQFHVKGSWLAEYNWFGFSFLT